jgi:hypothetical protein
MRSHPPASRPRSAVVTATILDAINALLIGEDPNHRASIMLAENVAYPDPGIFCNAARRRSHSRSILRFGLSKRHNALRTVVAHAIA